LIVSDGGATDTEKSPFTVIVRFAGLLLSPVLSVTVSDATNVPGAEYVTLPGFCTELHTSDTSVESGLGPSVPAFLDVLPLNRRPLHRQRSRVESPGNEQIATDEKLRLHAPLAAVRAKLTPKCS
jgi:hypothetical protein